MVVGCGSAGAEVGRGCGSREACSASARMGGHGMGHRGVALRVFVLTEEEGGGVGGGVRMAEQAGRGGGKRG